MHLEAEPHLPCGAHSDLRAASPQWRGRCGTMQEHRLREQSASYGAGASNATAWNRQDPSPRVHKAYERPAEEASRRELPILRPRPYPAPQAEPTGGHPSAPDLTVPILRDAVQSGSSERVCHTCHTWSSCCFCDAPPDAMRHALRRIAELHSGCAPGCPERQRLAEVPHGASSGQRPH